MDWLHWTLIPTLLAGWFWQNCVHELSHLLFIWILHSKKPKGFYPYPHKYEGRFYFARYRCEPYQYPGHPFVHAAPLFGASAQALLVVFAYFFFPWDTWPYFATLLLCPAVDVLWWYRGFWWGRQGTDGQRYIASKAIRKTHQDLFG